MEREKHLGESIDPRHGCRLLQGGFQINVFGITRYRIWLAPKVTMLK